MKNGLVAAIVGALVAGGLAYAIWGRQATDLRQEVTSLEQQAADASAALTRAAAVPAPPPPVRKRATTIILKADPSDATKCGAELEDDRINGRQRRKVAWLIEQHDTTPCSGGFGWSVELRFDEVDGEFPFQTKNIPLGQDGRFHRIKRTGKNSTVSYPYTIWFKPSLGAPYPMLDPDLEVEPPPSPLVPPANPPGNPPGNPPAPTKKP